MIEEGISLNINDSDGLTPLAYALKNDDIKMFDLLISKGADINKNFRWKLTSNFLHLK